MRDVLLGILGGLGEAHEKDQQNLLQQEVARRKNIADSWQFLAEHPDTRPETRDLAFRNRLLIAQTPYGKKLPKEVEDFGAAEHPAMQIGQSIQAPPTDSSANPGMQSPIAPGILPDVSAPIPPPTLSQDTVNKWPDNRAPSPFYTTEEKTRMQQQSTQAAIEAAGQKAYSEEKGRTRALYSPENIQGIIATEQAKKPVTIIPRGGTAIDAQGRTIGVGQPYERTPDQQMLEAASQIVAKRHNLSIKDDLGIGIFGKLPPSLQAEAAQEHALMKENPDAAEIRKLGMTRSKLLNQETQLRINDLLAENNPDSFDKIADLVNDSPDALFNYSPKDVAKISNAMLVKGYPVPRKPLPATQQVQVSNAELVMQNISDIRAMIQKYPDVVGPIVGRAGLTEEEWGAPIFDARNDPEKASVEQELRNRMKYLIAQDLKALIGARPPQQWLQELQKSSPRPQQALPFLEGSLRGMEGSAGRVLDQAYRTRYGTQPTATGRGPSPGSTATPRPSAAPTTPGAPTPPPGGRAAAPPAAGAGGGKAEPGSAGYVTLEDVQAFADDPRHAKMTLAQAEEQFRSQGFTILPPTTTPAQRRKKPAYTPSASHGVLIPGEGVPLSLQPAPLNLSLRPGG
jgi:hypothetical protein